MALPPLKPQGGVPAKVEVIVGFIWLPNPFRQSTETVCEMAEELIGDQEPEHQRERIFSGSDRNPGQFDP